MATTLLEVLVIKVLIVSLFLCGCENISSLDYNVQATGNPNDPNGNIGIGVGGKITFRDKARRLPNYSKDK